MWTERIFDTGWQDEQEGGRRDHANTCQRAWLGTKQAGVCAVGYMSSPEGETFREECEPTLPQGSPKGDMSGSEHPRDSACPKGKTNV
jgi:hypothetical protein